MGVAPRLNRGQLLGITAVCQSWLVVTVALDCVHLNDQVKDRVNRGAQGLGWSLLSQAPLLV